MEYLVSNLWWMFVTAVTLICVTIGTVWLMQAIRNKYLIVYSYICKEQQSIKTTKETVQIPADPSKTPALKTAQTSLKKVKSKPIIVQDPNYVRENRRRRTALRGVCNLATIREEYTPISYLYNPILF